MTARRHDAATRFLLKAGLADPRLHGDRFVGGGADWFGYDHIAGLMRSVLPLLEASEIVAAEEVGIDSLGDRLRQDIVSRNGVIVYQTLVRAWASRH
jgi:hypothetical protein